MGLEVWFSFVLVALVAVLSPGPAVLLAVTHAGQHGARHAVLPILGNISGLAVMTALTAYGLGSVLEASSEWFFWLRIIGGLYLVYLGVKLLLAHPQAQAMDGGFVPALPSWRKSYFQGVLVALSNPKAILFIGALFPQFIDVAQPVWGQFTILGLTLMGMSFSALIMYAAVSSSLINRGRQALYGRINKVSGALFIMFGIALSAGSR